MGLFNSYFPPKSTNEGEEVRIPSLSFGRRPERVHSGAHARGRLTSGCRSPQNIVFSLFYLFLWSLSCTHNFPLTSSLALAFSPSRSICISFLFCSSLRSRISFSPQLTGRKTRVPVGQTAPGASSAPLRVHRSSAKEGVVCFVVYYIVCEVASSSSRWARLNAVFLLVWEKK